MVTVRRDEPAPDALRALWKDDLCAFVELAELSRADVERLLGEVLGGPLDGRSRRALWELTRGNGLFLRELVRYGARARRARRGRRCLALARRAGGRHAAGGARRRARGRRSAPPSARRSRSWRSARRWRRACSRPARRSPSRRSSATSSSSGEPTGGGAWSTSRIRCTARSCARGWAGRAVRRSCAGSRTRSRRGARGGGRTCRGWPSGASTPAGAGIPRCSSARRGRRSRRSTTRSPSASPARRWIAAAASGRASRSGARSPEPVARMRPRRCWARSRREAVSDDERAAVAVARARNLFWALGRAAEAEALLVSAEAAVADRGVRERAGRAADPDGGRARRPARGARGGRRAARATRARASRRGCTPRWPRRRR